MDFYDYDDRAGMGAALAVILAATFVALFALVLTTGGGATTNALPPRAEIVSSGSERYPDLSGKFAPSGQKQPATVQRGGPAGCQGEKGWSI